MANEDHMGTGSGAPFGSLNVCNVVPSLHVDVSNDVLDESSLNIPPWLFEMPSMEQEQSVLEPNPDVDIVVGPPETKYEII